MLRNSNPLPAAWRLSGLENLGEDFSVSQDEGVVGPCSELEVYLHFMASKALSVKKTIRLEVRAPCSPRQGSPEVLRDGGGAGRVPCKEG